MENVFIVVDNEVGTVGAFSSVNKAFVAGLEHMYAYYAYVAPRWMTPLDMIAAIDVKPMEFDVGVLKLNDNEVYIHKWTVDPSWGDNVIHDPRYDDGHSAAHIITLWATIKNEEIDPR